MIGGRDLEVRCEVAAHLAEQGAMTGVQEGSLS